MFLGHGHLLRSLNKKNIFKFMHSTFWKFKYWYGRNHVREEVG